MVEVELPAEELVEEEPVSYTVEIPVYEYKSVTQFNEDLKNKFNAINDDAEEYKEIPPSILDKKPELLEKFANSQPLNYLEQKELGNLFEEHISKLLLFP